MCFIFCREWYRKFLIECPDGVLTKSDLHTMYARIMPKEDPSVIIDHLFRIFDRDCNGTIDFKEFVLATDITTSGAPEEKLRWTFKVTPLHVIYLLSFAFVLLDQTFQGKLKLFSKTCKSQEVLRLSLTFATHDFSKLSQHVLYWRTLSHKNYFIACYFVH